MSKLENNAVSTKAIEVVKEETASVDFAAFRAKPLVSLSQAGQGRITPEIALRQGRALLERKLDFINPLGVENARKYAKFGRVEFGAIGNLDSTNLHCLRCGKTHGLPNHYGNGPDWNIPRLALTPVYLVGGKLGVISETCSAKYVLPHVEQGMEISSKALFLAYFRPIKVRIDEQEKKEARKAR